MTRVSRNVGAVAVLAAMTVLVGCGDDSSGGRDDEDAAAGEAWAKDVTAQEAWTGATERIGEESVRFRLDDRSDGERLRLDVTIIDADNCFGTVRMDDDPTVDFTVTDGTDYLRTSRAGWLAFGLDEGETPDDDDRAAAEVFTGKWVTLGAAQKFCQVLSEFDSGKATKKLGPGEVDGEPALKVRVVDPDDDAATQAKDKSVAFVATAEPHRLLKITDTDVLGTFTAYGEATESPVPPKDLQLDPRKAFGGG